MTIPSASAAAAAVVAIVVAIDCCWPKYRPMSQTFLVAVAGQVIRHCSNHRFQPNRNQVNGDPQRQPMRLKHHHRQFDAVERAEHLVAADVVVAVVVRCVAGVVG